MSEPRDYYVDIIRDKRVALLAGPFETHDEALALVGEVRSIAYDVDPWTWFDLCGTCSLPRSPDNPVGKLNDRLSRPNQPTLGTAPA